MKLAIIGSRDFDNYSLLKETISKYLNISKIEEIISGGASGADSLGAKFARENNIKLTEFPAQWYDLSLLPCKIKKDKNGKEYNVLAGFNRNTDIVNAAEFILAFSNGSNGTEDSINKARKSKKTILIISF